MLKQVNKRTLTPVNAVWFNAIIAILLNLLIFGGVAISAVFSIGAIAAFVAFILPILVKTFHVGSNFRRGPWHLGKLSKPSGFLATAFVFMMLPILCFPTVTGENLTPDMMNWTILVYVSRKQ
jgi:amino acid transporter